MTDDFAVIGRAVTEAITAMASVRCTTPVGSRHWAELDAAVIGLADAAGLLEGLRREHHVRGTWITWLESLRAASLRRQRSAGSRSLVTGQDRYDGTVLDLRGRK